MFKKIKLLLWSNEYCQKEYDACQNKEGILVKNMEVMENFRCLLYQRTKCLGSKEINEK